MQLRKKLLIVMVLALGLSYVAQNYIFTPSGDALQPQVVDTVTKLPQQLNTWVKNLSFKKSVTTPEPNFPLFPTGSLIVGPSTVVQPTAIIYPTAEPTLPPEITPYIDVDIEPTDVPLPTIIYNTPTPRPLPTATPWPTNRPQPTATPYRPPTSTPVPTSPPASQITTMDEWGECLKNHGLTMYVVSTCAVCSQQKNMLGAAFKHIPSVMCNQNSATCTAVGVRTVPSYGRNGTIVIPGGTTLDYIAEVFECQLPN